MSRKDSDAFRFAGHPTGRFKQIDNVVPPLLAKAIGNSIIQSLASETVRTAAQSSPNAFREPLQKWHLRCKRQFPWRRLRNPWKILLAEMCLRRTRANQVAAVYGDLINVAPNPRKLLANRERVRSLLSHLGLAWRADTVAWHWIWRDAGFIAGALLAGAFTDLFGFSVAIQHVSQHALVLPGGHMRL